MSPRDAPDRKNAGTPHGVASLMSGTPKPGSPPASGRARGPVLSHDVEPRTGDRSDVVVHRTVELAAQELPHEATGPEIHDQWGSRGRAVRSWRWPLTRSPRTRWAGAKSSAYLKAGSIQQPLVLRVDAQHPQTACPVTGSAAWPLRSTARRCCGAGDPARGPRIARVGRRRSVDRVVVQPPRDVQRGDDADAARRPGRRRGARDDPARDRVRRRNGRSVSIAARPSHASPGSRVTTFTRPDSAWPYRAEKRVGHERRFAEQIRREVEAEATRWRRRADS